MKNKKPVKKQAKRKLSIKKFDKKSVSLTTLLSVAGSIDLQKLSSLFSNKELHSLLISKASDDLSEMNADLKYAKDELNFNLAEFDRIKYDRYLTSEDKKIETKSCNDAIIKIKEFLKECNQYSKQMTSFQKQLQLLIKTLPEYPDKYNFGL